MGFLSVDGTFFIQLVNFAIFFAILNYLFLRPVGQAIARRREYIESVTEDYDRYQAEANALRAEAEGLRAAARREAETLLSRARAQASNQSAKISSEYAERAAQIAQEADRVVARELETARARSVQTTRELADIIVGRAIPELAH